MHGLRFLRLLLISLSLISLASGSYALEPKENTEYTPVDQLKIAGGQDSKEYKEYTVVKGDTLWDIAGKELGDKFLWPKIWKENPEIPNPDRLRPGQKIRIPLYLYPKEVKETAAPVPEVKKAPEPVKEPERPAPEKLFPLVDKNLLIASGYVADSISGLGRIGESASGRTLFGNDDIVYVKMANPANVGDRFYIVRVADEIIHPVTNRRFGYIMEIAGIAEIIRPDNGEPRARITKAFREIMMGDLLDTYYEVNPPLTTGRHRSPDINGLVVAVRNLHILGGKHDIVYLDRGQADGIEIGDMFKTVKVGLVRAEEHRVTNGVIQIINFRDKTATAIIREGTEPVTPGNIFTQLEQ